MSQEPMAIPNADDWYLPAIQVLFRCEHGDEWWLTLELGKPMQFDHPGTILATRPALVRARWQYGKAVPVEVEQEAHP